MAGNLELLIYAPLLGAVAISLIHACLRAGRGIAALPYCLCLDFCVAGILVCVMLPLIPRLSAFIEISRLKPTLEAFLPVCLIFAIAGYYRISKVLRGWIPYVICLVPAAAGMLAVWDTARVLFNGQEAVTAPVWWGYVQLVQGLLTAMAALLLLALRCVTLPPAYRSGSLLLLLGTIFCLADSVWRALPAVSIVPAVSSGLDYGVICSCACGLLLHFALVIGGRVNYQHLERHEAFGYLDEVVLILNKNDQVIDCNNSATPFGGAKKGLPFEERVERLAAEGRVARKGADSRGREDLHLQDDRFDIVYEMMRLPGITERSGAGAVIMTDVTNNRLFIERLREADGVDALTGLPNRYRYLRLMGELDHERALPLSIIKGDVNGLKAVNDTHGYAGVDELLQVMARVLAECCPDGGHVARLGGGEFVMLLPGCSDEQARMFMNRIYDAAASVEVLGVRPSIALGSVTKRLMEENINYLLLEAGRMMYGNKQEARQISDC